MINEIFLDRQPSHQDGVVFYVGIYAWVNIDGRPWYLEAILAGIKIHQDAIDKGIEVMYHKRFLEKLEQARKLLESAQSIQPQTTDTRPTKELLQEELPPLSVVPIDDRTFLIDGRINVTLDTLFPLIDKTKARLIEQPNDAKAKVLLVALEQIKQIFTIRITGKNGA